MSRLGAILVLLLSVRAARAEVSSAPVIGFAPARFFNSERNSAADSLVLSVCTPPDAMMVPDCRSSEAVEKTP